MRLLPQLLREGQKLFGVEPSVANVIPCTRGNTRHYSTHESAALTPPSEALGASAPFKGI